MTWWKLRKKITVLTPLEGYNRWSSTYHHESNPIKDLSDQLVEKLLPDLKDKNFLDAGCGTGKFCSLAEKKNAARIVGLDLSPNMIEIARQQCKSAEFRSGDLSSVLIEENNYDVIVCALVLGHLEHLTPALDSLLKALRHGGVLIITDFHPFLTLLQAKRTFRETVTGKNFEVRHHLHLFEDYFKVISLHHAVVETLEEPRYNNSPAVFGFRIRKT